MKMLAAIVAILAAAPALAQKQGPAAPPPEKVNQVLVYGDQPCPKPQGDEIVICKRSPDDPYRLPKALRTDPLATQNQSWANRAKDLDQIASIGPQACSSVGTGGFGCLKGFVTEAYAQQKIGESLSTSLIEGDRGKRLGKIDAESAAIEEQAKLDEAAAKAAPVSGAAPPR